MSITTHHDETSEALIRAAHTILETSGPEALTVRRIAAEAGMSTMNVYSRFDGKTGVIDELYADGYRRLAATLQGVPTTSSIVDDIMNVMRAYRDFAIRNRTYYSIMFRSSAVPSFEPSQASVAVASTCLYSLCARVELAQARREFVTHDDWSPTEIASWLWATAHGLVCLEIHEVGNEHVSWSRVFERGVQTAVRGLMPLTQPVHN